MSESNSQSQRALALAIVAVLTSSALPVLAQTDDTTQTLDRVVVTGTRIKKADVVGQAPVRVLRAEELQKSGLNSIAEVLQQLSASGNSLNIKFNSSGNFGYPPSGGGVGAGSAQVDLRHLGSNRVLVLVDGVRWVNESSASGVSAAVDLNTMPMSMIDSIEVLEDGASAIYGSDAIAGVVNIITKRDMEGALLNVQRGQNWSEEDGENTSADLSWGKRGDDFSIFLTASYNEQERVNSSTRPQASFPVPGAGLEFGSSATPQGRFRFEDPRNPGSASGNLALIPGVNGIPRYNPANPTNAATSDFRPFSTQDRFNFAPFNLLITPSERRGLFGQFRYNLSETASVYVRTLYNERESVNQAAPEPIFIGFGAGTGGLADRVSISRTNPFNPFGIDLNATGPNANFRFLGRRPIEGGPRIFTQAVDTFYLAAGAEGTFDAAERSFSWNVDLARGKNDAEQKTRGSYNMANIARALGPIANCTAPCVPLNLFGGQGSNGQGTITPAMLNYIGFNGIDTSEQSLNVIAGNITGDLFALPAGAASFSTGVEYRKLEGSFNPDPVIVRGESNGVPAQPGGGKYDVKEIFGEVNLPLATDIAYAKRLDLSLAGRYSDYSTSGGESTGKVSLRWQTSDDLTLRGTYSQGFRAPSIGELFGGPAQFDAVITDPCNAVSPTGVALNRPAGCTALGVPANYRQTNQQISMITGGNPALKPESADSISAGLVYSPGWSRDSAFAKSVDFELTYYKHEIDNAVQPLDAQAQLQLCAAETTAGTRSVYCDGISRVTTGEINGFQNRLQNFGSIETDGVDLTVNWRLPDTNIGVFNANWSTTYVDDYIAKDPIGNIDPRTVGVERADGAIAEFQSNLDLSWDYSIFGANWTVRYIDSVNEDCGEDFQGTGLCSNDNSAIANADSFNTLSSTVYHDAKLTWRTPLINEGLTLNLGVNNLFDRDPPICLTCSLNGYDASTYDPPGSRFAYARASVKF